MENPATRKIKILYVITKSNFGGAQRYVYDLASAMKKRGHEVTVVLGGAGLLKIKLEGAEIRTHAIASLKRDISVTDDAVSFKTIYSIIKTERPDVIHLNSPKAGGLGAFACRFLNASRFTLHATRIIYTVHGWAFNEDRLFYERATIRLFSWLTMLLCHKTILLSQREYTQALGFPFVKNKLALVPLGIKPPVYFSREKARELLNITQPFDISKGCVIGTVAELHPNKGLTFLIDAMAVVVKKHPNTVCVIIGGGQDRKALESLIREKQLERTVFLTGYIDEASKYLKAFDIFVLPSLKEGLPYAILEAGLASLPVIATSVGGIPEIIENRKSGLLIAPKSSSELAHTISFMIEHPKEREQYGLALRQSTTQKFSFDKMLATTKNLYKSP